MEDKFNAPDPGDKKETYPEEKKDSEGEGYPENIKGGFPDADQIISSVELKKYGRRRCFDGILIGVILAFVCVIIVFFGPVIIGNSSVNNNPGSEVLTDDSTMIKLSQVQSLIDKYYLYDVDGDYLEAYLFRGVAAGLDDDYADYYTEDEFSSVLDSSRGEYYGIGVTVGTDSETGEFYIGEVYEDGPADEAGLAADDIILAIDGEAAENYDLSGLVSLIKSKDTFTMTVYRPDTEEKLDLTVTCGDVIPVYVTYELMENNIGYLKLTEFTSSAVEQFQAAAADLNSLGMEKLIVDLRDNPGGLLSAVCDIIDEIIPGGLIVYTEDKNGNREEYTADNEQNVTCEIAVLVNGNSASASEIFAGVIQDYAIGPVIGTTTYGKGVVQKTFTLSDGSALKMTVENYYTPQGRQIEGNGITPDIVVEEEENKENEEDEYGAVTDKVLECAIEALKNE